MYSLSKKTMVQIFFAIMASGQMAHAFQFANPSRVLREIRIPASETCTDFSGSWKGTCKDDGKPAHEDSMQVTQYGCLALNADDVFLVMGGSKTQADVFPFATTSDPSSTLTTSFVLSSDWNASREEINVHAFFLMRQSGRGNVASDDLRGTLKLENQSLVINLRGASSGTTCVYERQK